mgnify:CR=1 FL=1
MYGFIIPAKGMELLTGLLAGDTLTITRCMVGTGQVPAETQPTALTDLVQPIAQATSTQPLVHGQQVDFTIEYRNDLQGGLESGFYLREFGVFARAKDGADVMIYYGNLGDYPQWVQPYTQGAVEVRRFPVAIGVSNAPTVILEYNADAFMTAEDVSAYCTTVILPQFLDEARRLIAQHNTDKAAHPSILGTIDQFDSRLSLIELQYGTDVNGNPFRVTFENLDEVDVQGVWNQNAKRIEF